MSLPHEEEPTGPIHLPADDLSDPSDAQPADSDSSAGSDEISQPSPPSEPESVDNAPEKAAHERSSAVHWMLAIGEVVLAVAIGVGLSYVFRLLWDITPYVASVLAPVVICAVVGIVGLSRKKLGLGAIPLGLLLLVLFVTALLVVVPAAWVLNGQ